ncbi:MAG TPA: phosphate ABC transporter substrate-binding protein [Candidatus Caccousia avicola]|uniref:Phosphate-binding protein n=1 Tax=Candidatus Caccousia avicola TaxID=2840721 RepID=A0A9D1ANX4_9FIRM|nr:phosphate ABC transporter substrate-binding protein [Candidatus Caccousia avicola]
MKRALSLLLAAVLCTGMFAGCAGTENTSSAAASTAEESKAEESKTEESAADATADLSGTVSTNGSTSMEEVMMGLTEYFKEKYPNVTVTYDPTGSGTGIQQATAGSCDIGLSSRALKDEEKEAGVTETVVAKDGIAIVVNKENTVTELTVDQITKIATGEITNWSEVGGADMEIAFIGREAGSGTRGAFEELTGTEDACSYNQELTSTGAVRTAVSTTPGGIGYISLSSLDDSVNALKVKADDASPAVECSEETVLDGSYPIQRPFVFATKTDAPLSEAAQAFYDFALSAEAAQIYSDAGVVPAN